MLMRTDPFRELDRLTQQVFGAAGTRARPAGMPMDAWRDGEVFHVEFDLPGVDPNSVDVDVERNVVTVKAERPAHDAEVELIAAERPRGVIDTVTTRRSRSSASRVTKPRSTRLSVSDVTVGFVTASRWASWLARAPSSDKRASTRYCCSH